MRSRSRLTAKASRRSLPLKIMCSRKCVTPETSGVSSRAPVRTQNPSATDRAEGMVSPRSRRPLTWLAGCLICYLRLSVFIGGSFLLQFQGRRAQGDDGKVVRRITADMLDDAFRRQAVERLLDLLDGADALQEVPVRCQGAS